MRRPERRQVAMLIQCPDDLVSANHPVRLVMAVVEKLDLKRFHEPIKARAGQAGRGREAGTAGASHCAVARTEAETGRNGSPCGPWQARRANPQPPAARSTTDAQARVMKMPNGGFNPAVNVQLATDTASRAILGVEVTNEGSDNAGLSEPMRRQVEQRTGGKVEQQLIDGGYMRSDDIEQAHGTGVELFVPPKPARRAANQGRELEPKTGDSEALLAWKRRMASAEGKEIYKERAATSETVNADLRTYRGLSQFTVRGLAKIRCVALWCALAYNLMHFAVALLS